MKKWHIIVAIAAFLLLLAGLTTHFVRSELATEKSNTLSDRKASPPDGHLGSLTPVGNGPTGLAPKSSANPQDIANAELEARNSQRIDVYGKVVDQNGSPVPGVSVHGGVLLNNGFDSTTSRTFDTITDDNGRFSFLRLGGVRFGVKFEKPGYTYNQKNYLFWWNSYHPDPSNPAIFVIYRLQGAVPLNHVAWNGRIPYDGQSARFDLKTGRKSPTGEFQMALTRNPLVVRRGYEQFDWNLRIDVIGGGLVESHDAYPYEAPADGYQPEFVISVSRNDASWTQRFIKTFYVHTSGGNFGRVDIDLTVDSERPQGTGFSIEDWINPESSRNLEFSSALEIKP